MVARIEVGFGDYATLHLYIVGRSMYTEFGSGSFGEGWGMFESRGSKIHDRFQFTSSDQVYMRKGFSTDNPQKLCSTHLLI